MKIGFDYIGITTPFYCHDGNGNILMHKRTEKCRDEHFCWDPGAGKQEFGISLEDNVLKEVMEEYGCNAVVEERLAAHDVFREVDGKKVHWVVVPFFVKVNPKDVKIGEPEKMSELGWFSLDKLPSPLTRGFEYSLNYLRKDFEKKFQK